MYPYHPDYTTNGYMGDRTHFNGPYQRPPRHQQHQQPHTFSQESPHHAQYQQKPKQIQPRRKVLSPPMSFVGQPGYPDPAPPCQEKAPFTAKDNEKLKLLKERTDPTLSWRQIGEFFPGRTFNTLQVHYCTKIKGINIDWTPELDRQLRKAVREDEAGKGKRIAKKFGGVFTPEDCEKRMKVIGDCATTPASSEPADADADADANANANVEANVEADEKCGKVWPYNQNYQPAAPSDNATTFPIVNNNNKRPRQPPEDDRPPAALPPLPLKRQYAEPLSKESSLGGAGQSLGFWKIV